MTFDAQLTFLVKDAFLQRVGPVAYQARIEGEIIEKTGWTLDELDAAPPHRLRRVIRYWNRKAEHEREQAERAGSGSGG